MKDYKFSEEHRKKISQTRIARNIVPWNKGAKMSEETRRKQRDWWEKHRDEMIAKRNGHTSSLKGRPISDEHRERITKNAAKPWLGKHLSEEHKKKLSAYRLGTSVGPFSETHKKKISSAHKKLWQDPAFVKMKHLSFNQKPTKPEMHLGKILEHLYPGQWKYTGDFSFTINGKCPDFVNCNGQKKIIEMFGDYWHRGENPDDRAEVFKPFGYETLVIWERELKNIKAVENKIRLFARKAG